MKNRLLLITLAILTMGCFIASKVRAQNPPEEPQEPQAPQAPQTAVARLSVIHGDVSTMRGDSGEWVAGTVNTPVVPGDKVATADRSRAEVQLDFANIMRLDQRTEAKVADLAQNKIQIQLSSGLVDFSIFKGTEADVEIDTPNMGVHPLAEGLYRVQVNSATETQLTVLRGQAEVLTDQGNTKVEAGQIIFIHGADNPEYRVDQAPGRDDFDKWAGDRDRQITQAQTWQHTDPQYTGANDLDAYGQWEQVPGYDFCWTPQVDMGWAPYRMGRWGYEPYWGWTWISAEPWGWAPYHYGRWFMYGDRWHWWPGRGFGGGRPAWGPGYVSFFGFGGRGFGVGVGFGSIGWLPLGPRDVFHPWYGGGRGFNVININEFHSRGAGFTTPGGRPYGSNLENMMSNGRVRGALTNVSQHDFVNGHMSHGMPVSEGMLHSASVMRGSLPVTPTRAILGNRVGNPGSFRSGGANSEHFFSRSSTPGRFGGNTGAFGARGNGMATGRAGMEAGRQPGQGASNNNWSRYATGNQAGRPAGNAPSFGGQRSTPAPQGNQGSWRGFSSRPAPSGGRTGYAQPTQRGGWQGYSGQPRSYSGGGNAGGSRPPLELNRPLMRQRPEGGYFGGGRSYSAPSGGGRNYSAPSGGGRNYSAPSGGGRGYSAPSGGSQSNSAPRGGGGGGGSHGGGGGSHGGGGGGGSHGGGGRH
jgi:hypothetical protein